MKVIDVKNAVLGYGYSRDLADNDELFYTVLNLAMKEVNRIRPLTEMATIVHEPIKPLIADHPVKEKKPGEDLIIEGEGRSVVFEVSGSGGVDVDGGTIDGHPSATWTAQGWKRLIARGDGRLRLTFSGESPYHVRNVAFYDVDITATSGRTVGEVTEYDLSSFVTSFAAPVLPIMKDGIPMNPSDPRTLIINGRLLRIPNLDKGTYEVECEVYPPRYVNEGDDEKNLPLDEDVAELVPLLVASYIWLDDEPEKSVRYKNLYDAAKREIRGSVKISHVIDRKGWS